MDVPSMTRALEAEGVGRIVVCAEDPHRYPRRARWAPGVQVVGRDKLTQVQEQLRQVPGVSVIVYDQRCAAEARRLRKRGLLEEPPRRVFINEAVCEGCGDCSVKSNCLSVLPHDTEFGEKRQIHDPSCNRDYTCLEGDCPSFVTITPKPGRRWRAPARNGSAPARPALPVGALPTPAIPRVEDRYSIYFTGIGGTGVVTANRILAAAAEAAGLAVGGMDQTGLSQKAGAVVSHLHLATRASALTAATVGAGGANLYLSGDILQAASPAHLDKVAPGRTTAVVDSTFTPTASMLQRDVPAPDGTRLQAAIADRAGEDRAIFVNTKRIAETVFDNHLLANVVLLGAAYQLDALPLSMADIEAAVRQQGRSAGDNREAFEWGRWAVHDPAAVEESLSAVAAAREANEGGLLDPSPDALTQATRLVGERRLPAVLTELLSRRAAQAIDYQDAGRATRFLDLVEMAAAADDSDHGWELTRTVAESWFKLLTYKDEYEVARLHLKANYDSVAHDLGIDGPYSVTYHLHPPVLRRMGLSRKLPMGKPYELAFHALQRMKRLRGTPFDVFGWDHDRRTERAIIDEYERVVTQALRSRPALRYASVVELAESAQSVKGYGPIKEAAVDRWRQRVAELSASSVTRA
jgi:indolepyruvate ferredoxin oxidoreductase